MRSMLLDGDEHRSDGLRSYGACKLQIRADRRVDSPGEKIEHAPTLTVHDLHLQLPPYLASFPDQQNID